VISAIVGILAFMTTLAVLTLFRRRYSFRKVQREKVEMEEVPIEKPLIEEEPRVGVPRETRVGVPRETRVGVPRETRVGVPRETRVGVPRETEASAVCAREFEQVNFAAFAPRSITPNCTFILDIWAYLPFQYSSVSETARELGRDVNIGQKTSVS